MAHTTMLKVREVAARKACDPSSIYRDAKKGLFTKPIKVSFKSSGWPDYEVETIIRAHIAGKSPDQIRALVTMLEAARVAPDDHPQKQGSRQSRAAERVPVLAGD